MTRLIDADALLEALNKAQTYNSKVVDKIIDGQMLTIEDLITNAPTIEQGEWVHAIMHLH